MEIKFIGKRKDNGEWVYGGYHKHQKTELCPIYAKGEKQPKPEIVYMIIQDGFADWNMPKPINGIEVIPSTVGQFTGLKDKNGKETYQHDVIKGYYYDMYSTKHRFIGKIVFEKGKFVAEGLKQYKERSKDLSGIFGLSEFTVIGNIFDNPELL